MESNQATSASAGNPRGTTKESSASAEGKGGERFVKGKAGDQRGGDRNNNDRRRGSGGRGRDRRPMRDEAPKEFSEVTISIDRVARVVKGGRRFRFKALVVAGNGKGKVGVGVAKGQDVTSAVTKAGERAKKNLIVVPMKGTTIPHEMETKVAGAHVLIKPASEGTGIVAGGVVRSIVSLAGISNLISKSIGSTNKVNIAYATIDALKELKPRDQWVGAKADVKAKIAPKTAAKGAK